jgi:hypothetical protein
MIEEEPKAPHAKSAYGSPRPHWGNHARKKYGNYKICDEHFYSYWVPGLVELIFPAGGLAVLFLQGWGCFSLASPPSAKGFFETLRAPEALLSERRAAASSRSDPRVSRSSAERLEQST